MPIRNSVVESSEVFTRRRKNRLNAYRANNDEPDETPGQLDQGEANPQVPVPETQQRPDDTTVGDVTDGPSVEPEQSTGQSDENLQDDESKDVDRLADEEEPKPEQGPAPARQRKKPAKAPAKSSDKSDQMYLKMNVAHPAAGVSPTFDQLATLQGEKVAFRLVLGKALDLYAASVMDGAASSAPASYAESPTTLWTTRAFPKAAYTAFAKEINRMGLASERTIGTAIGRRALAAFVANDRESD